MGFISIGDANRPTNLYYREHGAGFPLLFLHGGWGYGIYPFDAQVARLAGRFRILIPDRTGYGKSPRLGRFVRGFHQVAAQEMRDFLDGLGIGPCVLWGHSDGAVTAARMAIAQPDRFPAVVLEAVHYDRCKTGSRGFFETAAANPRKFGAALVAAMAQEHGDDYWEYLLTVHGQAWLDILDTCQDPALDLYSGRIGELRSPALLIHGSRDPRTEPGELEQLRQQAPALELALFAGAQHSPHSEAGFADEVTLTVAHFLKNTGRIPGADGWLVKPPIIGC
jgi:pimeloyl-ACP methyl ester carboxylesterase